MANLTPLIKGLGRSLDVYSGLGEQKRARREHEEDRQAKLEERRRLIAAAAVQEQRAGEKHGMEKESHERQGRVTEANIEWTRARAAEDRAQAANPRNPNSAQLMNEAYEDAIASGMSREQAAAEVRRRFGRNEPRPYNDPVEVHRQKREIDAATGTGRNPFTRSQGVSSGGTSTHGPGTGNTRSGAGWRERPKPQASEKQLRDLHRRFKGDRKKIRDELEASGFDTN